MALATAPMPPKLTHSAHQPAYWVVGDRYTVLLSAEDTGGAFTLFEFVVPPGRGSPPHIHRRESETFHILEGTVEFTVDGTKHLAKVGDTVFGPKDVPHNFANVGDVDARMLVVCQPGGLEGFFAAAGVPAGDRTSPPPTPTAEDKQRMLAHAAAFGVELLVPGGH